MSYGVSGVELLVRAQREFETKTMYLRAICPTAEIYAAALDVVRTTGLSIDDVIRELTVLGRLARDPVERVFLEYWPILSERGRAELQAWLPRS